MTTRDRSLFNFISANAKILTLDSNVDNATTDTTTSEALVFVVFDSSTHIPPPDSVAMSDRTMPEGF